jgi:hypothetical protein
MRKNTAARVANETSEIPSPTRKRPDFKNPVIARVLALAKTADPAFVAFFSLYYFFYFSYIPFFIFLFIYRG